MESVGVLLAVSSNALSGFGDSACRKISSAENRILWVLLVLAFQLGFKQAKYVR